MSEETGRRPFALLALAAVYLFSLLLAFSDYGAPFPFMGDVYQGSAGRWLVFGDSMICLYLVVGILKRQRFTLWLLVGYNLLDMGNACVNLLRMSAEEYALCAGTAVARSEVCMNTFAAVLVVMLLNVYALGNRRHFDNGSPYLF